MTAEHKQYIKQWLEKAEHDLIAAQVLVDVRPFILDVACFHCQQAVEKFFKAFLIYKGADIQKTHDIILLKKKCSEFDMDFDTFDLKDLLSTQSDPAIPTATSSRNLMKQKNM